MAPTDPESLAENPGARLCRPRPAAANLEYPTGCETGRALRLVCDPAALLFQTASEIFVEAVILEPAMHLNVFGVRPARSRFSVGLIYEQKKGRDIAEMSRP